MVISTSLFCLWPKNVWNRKTRGLIYNFHWGFWRKKKKHINAIFRSTRRWSKFLNLSETFRVISLELRGQKRRSLICLLFLLCSFLVLMTTVSVRKKDRDTICTFLPQILEYAIWSQPHSMANLCIAIIVISFKNTHPHRTISSFSLSIKIDDDDIHAECRL